METAAPIENLAQVATRWQDTMLSLEKEYEQEPEVLKIGEVAIGTLGNFSASIGKAKSKKTFNVSAMVAAALSGKEVLNYTTDFPKGKNRILYIDTEQSQNHCMIVMHRIMKLAELPTNENCDRFYFLALRKFNPKERLAIIDDAISQIEGLGFVVIDGIRDLVYDINSPSEATCVISKLMQWTDEYQIHLHTILHQNKSDENARGHIGTEINNKAETVIQLEKDKDDSNISKVESVHTRSKDFLPFAFCVNDQSLPELLPDYVPTKKSAGRPKQEPFSPYKDIHEAIHRKALELAFDGKETISGYKVLEEELTTAYELAGTKLNHNKIVELIKFLTNKRMVVQESRGYLSVHAELSLLILHLTLFQKCLFWKSQSLSRATTGFTIIHRIGRCQFICQFIVDNPVLECYGNLFGKITPFLPLVDFDVRSIQ